ncbi:MAG: aminotransferase class I/II-fold pyridoxal phosphate-dependent enzyme [Alphaproteobacteria bacterium]|nr:aminotransferase class I/II-fold pyridoxal phosphate-dependent enzyme [Alphaproteobacteria bacterium]
MKQDFYRIGRLPPYVFAEVNKVKAQARAAGSDIIDFGMGNPDSAPPPHVIEKLRETLKDPKVHRYSLSRGIQGLRKAQAAYYQRRFGVELDPENEVVVTIGSKEGLANMAQAISAPGDVFVVPDPSYPIHVWGFVIAGAEVASIPNVPGEEFFTHLKRTLDTAPKKPVALVVNYPCNPTAYTVDIGFYEQVVDICRHYEIYVLSDLAYCELYYGDKAPPSILQVKGAKDVAVEFTTMSKTYSMAGWRIGFAAGNKTLISALTKIKSYLDYGTFLPVQVAAAAALNGPQEYVTGLRAMYKERRDILAEGLIDAGWEGVVVPDASMFLWVPVPKAYAQLGCLEFSKLLMTEAEVAVAPGVGFGPGGEGFVRIALVENKHRIRQAVRGVKQFLATDPQKHIYALEKAV